jgi:formylmethanofuran dehydrogenase subunit E
VNRRWILAFAVGVSACAHASAVAPGATPPVAPAAATVGSSSPDDTALARVAEIHGGAGPWAVAGYRMGEYALGRLGLARQSFDLEVVHHTPQEVQYSCIADGAAAATGASAGKLNLKLVDATEANVATTYRRKSTGQSITLRPTHSFADRFRDVPREQLAAAGRSVLALPDAEVFEELPGPPSP